MKIANLNVYFFFLLLLGVGVVTFFVFQPFLTAILAAAILAIFFQEWYAVFLKYTRRRIGLSATLTVLLVATVIILPIFAVLGAAVNEAGNIYERNAFEGGSFRMTIEAVLQKIQAIPYLQFFIGSEVLDVNNIVDNLRGFTQVLLGFVQTLYQSVAHFVFWMFVMFFTLFYFLIDGKQVVGYVMRLSPLRNEHEKLLIGKFVSMSRATIKGTLMVSVVQGFLGGLTFAIVGIQSPVIWGLVMTVLSVIPLFGAGIIWLPAGIILLMLGQVWQGVLVLSVGMGIISTIDNILRPKLVGKDTQMHPLLVFFSTLGGISLFGFPGFVIGPIIVSLALALLEIYSIEFRGQLNGYNE